MSVHCSQSIQKINPETGYWRELHDPRSKNRPQFIVWGNDNTRHANRRPNNAKPKRRFNKRRADHRRKQAERFGWMDEPVDDTDLTSEILDALAIAEGWMAGPDAADPWDVVSGDREEVFPPFDDPNAMDDGADDPNAMDDNEFLDLCADTYALLR